MMPLMMRRSSSRSGQVKPLGRLPVQRKGKMDMRNFTTTLKENAQGEWFLMFEPSGDDMGLPKGFHLALDLPKGSTKVSAREIADFLNTRVQKIRAFRA
jgi:hypothetical protein